MPIHGVESNFVKPAGVIPRLVSHRLSRPHTSGFGHYIATYRDNLVTLP